MAEAKMYRSLGGGPGLASLPGEIRSCMEKSGIPAVDIHKMIGENIIRRLAGLN